jgi:hypothetical protein
MSRIFKCVIAALFFVASFPSAWAEEPDHAIHEELRALLKKLETSINSGKYEEMESCFVEKVRATTINQEVLSSRSEIPGYFKKWFGPGGYLKKLQMTLNADGLTELNAEKTFGTVRGSGQEDYTLADGRFFPMKTRWTATVVKDTDGVWRILSIHIGTNFLDNPILAKAESSLGYAAGGGLLAGILLTAGIAFVVVRKKRT